MEAKKKPMINWQSTLYRLKPYKIQFPLHSKCMASLHSSDSRAGTEEQCWHLNSLCESLLSNHKPKKTSTNNSHGISVRSLKHALELSVAPGQITSNASVWITLNINAHELDELFWFGLQYRVRDNDLVKSDSQERDTTMMTIIWQLANSYRFHMHRFLANFKRQNIQKFGSGKKKCVKDLFRTKSVKGIAFKKKNQHLIILKCPYKELGVVNWRLTLTASFESVSH